MDFIKELRNMASSIGTITIGRTQAVWSSWTVGKAVKDGYKASGWVYRSVSLIAQNVASVPWVVMNEKGEIQKDHPIHKLMNKPHPHLSRRQLISLIISWLELSGEAYLKKVENSEGNIVELWPISPDRIAPIPSSNPNKYIDGYEISDENGTKKKSPDFTEENIIQLKLFDPANPLNGIGPLQAAARAVDLDNSQQDWNASTMQNRGIVDGVFSFKRDLDSSQTAGILAKIKEKFSRNKREPLVIGSEATYTRLGLTSVEMDFLESRKFNREEIFVIFGVPPQLAGVTDASTYNNFATSLRIFWETTVISLLETVADQLNHALSTELEDGKFVLVPDTSGIKALRSSEDEKAKTSKTYFEMGVPVSILNDRFELGLPQYPGWDVSHVRNANPNPAEDTNRKSYSLIPFEKRSVETEQQTRDDIAEGVVLDMFESLLTDQQAAVFASLDIGEDPLPAVKTDNKRWLVSMQRAARSIAEEFAGMVVVDERGEKPRFDFRAEADDLLDQYLEQEAIMLQDLSHLTETTTNSIIEQIRYAQENNSTVDQLKQAIIDTGIYSSARALRLARTLTGTASSIGQLSGGIAAGATKKSWATAAFEVREAHVNRNGETVDINARFSEQISNIGPRFPLDPDISPADRINCRCSLRFE